MPQERKKELSLLNTLFCLFVIFIHIISYAVASFDYGSVKYNIVMFPWRMVSVVVPGFIMLSGLKMFLTHKDEMPYCKYLLSRIKSVILPYTVCFACYYIFYIAAYGYPLDIKFIASQYFLGSLACHFYFIPLLFQFDLLFPLWKKLIGKCSALIVIPFVLLLSLIFEIYFPNMISAAFPDVNFIYNDRIFTTYLSYWVVGCYIGKYYDSFTEIIKKNFAAICSFFGIAFVLFCFYTYLAFNYITYIPFMNQIHSLYTITVIMFLFAVFLKLPEKLPSFIAKIDTASYDIYLWHMIFVLAADHIISRFSITAQLPAFAIRFIFAYLVTIPLCVVWGKIKKKLLRRKNT